jgi:hypothetical protein
MIEGLDQRLLANLERWHGADLPQRYREFTNRVVGGYLEHVFAHLCLADQMSATPIDWEDISPVYRDVSSFDERTNSLQSLENARSVRQFFSVAPPQWRPDSIKRFVDMLQDDNLQEFRDMIAHSVDVGANFDSGFAERTLDSVYQRYGMVKAKFRSVTLILDSVEAIPIVGKLLGRVGKHVTDWSFGDAAIQDKKWLLVFCDPRSSWQ